MNSKSKTSLTPASEVSVEARHDWASIGAGGDPSEMWACCKNCGVAYSDGNAAERCSPESYPIELPRLKYLQPNQYDSWMRKIDDPDWYDHRYRDSKDNSMASAMRELRDTRDSLLAALSRISELKAELAKGKP